MSDRRIGHLLSLVRQGITLDLEFGTRSLESLLRIAEVVEESVYEPGSLQAIDRGLRFALRNPPLRVGAFGAVRVRVNGQPVPPTSLRFRRSAADPWREATDVARARPLDLLPGQRTEFEVAPWDPGAKGELTVRLELESVAIPPLVWFEFREPVRPGSGP